MIELKEHAHRRFNPLRQEWVLVSPHRNERPWQGQIESPAPDAVPVFDAICYLCPGNERAHGVRNPHYTSTFVFDNDFAALQPANPDPQIPTNPESHPSTGSGCPELVEGQIPNPDDLLTARAERGVCRVVCFSPRHDLTLGRMSAPEIRAVVDTWIDEYQSLAALPWVQYALVFENRGAMMGASNPHPHGQIWATESLPNDPARERQAFATHRSRRGTCLLCDYAGLETRLGERVVCDNGAFLALVPFWAVWPFETLLVSRRHVGAMHDLTEPERDALADILRRLITRYDNLFESPFPYSLGFHQQPIRPASEDGGHLHAHVYPPLLRSAAIRKFMVGFELLGSPQRDVTPEHAAARLQAASEVHYTTRASACGHAEPRTSESEARHQR